MILDLSGSIRQAAVDPFHLTLVCPSTKKNSALIRKNSAKTFTQDAISRGLEVQLQTSGIAPIHLHEPPIEGGSFVRTLRRELRMTGKGRAGSLHISSLKWHTEKQRANLNIITVISTQERRPLPKPPLLPRLMLLPP